MTEPLNPPVSNDRTPGVVLFAAVLNFLSAAVFYVVAFISIIGLTAGTATGMTDFVQRRFMEGNPAAAGMTAGMTFFFGVLFVVMAALGTFFLLIGIGLLKRKSLAWYVQVAMSVFGLLAFPIGTVVNGAILYFFFQHRVRDRYKV